jgi:hypothetical protein
LTVKLVKIWVYPMKFCEADPAEISLGLKRQIVGLPRRAPLNISWKWSSAYLTGVGLAELIVRPIVLGLKIVEFSACWTC